MTAQQHILDFYACPAGTTSAGAFAPMFDALPSDVGALVHIVQGLGVYDVVAPDFYGFTIPDERQNEIHMRALVVPGRNNPSLYTVNGRPLYVHLNGLAIV
jgi:hypothetical protein